MMGISNQDLVFKLKSIGVRVEGDDAHIDTEIIQAILQGKKLPHPREVILRDEQAPTAAEAGAPAHAGGADRRRGPRRPPANPLRPQRPRTLIQKVEPRIQTLPMTERHAPPARRWNRRRRSAAPGDDRPGGPDERRRAGAGRGACRATSRSPPAPAVEPRRERPRRRRPSAPAARPTPPRGPRRRPRAPGPRRPSASRWRSGRQYR